jgi:hypothetical protein
MIFGTLEPSIVLPDDTVINLDHSVVIKNEPDTKSFVNKNDLTGEDQAVKRGYHWLFDVRIYLYKYSNQVGTYQSLAAILETEVKFRPHRDHISFQDSLGNIVWFLFTEIVPEYITTTDIEAIYCGAVT